MRAIRVFVLAIGLTAASAACARSGFAPLAAPEPAASPRLDMPLVAARDVGRAYRVLGYVFRTSDGHKSGMIQETEQTYVIAPDSEQLTALRAKAAEKGADAIIGVELFPMLNGWGQPTGYAIGGWAVKFVDAPAPPASPPNPSGTVSPPASPSAAEAAATTPSPASAGNPAPAAPTPEPATSSPAPLP